jgi:hypothetical protein
MTLSRTVVTTVIGLVVTVCAIEALAESRGRTAARDTFFETLMGGGAENGLVYVEIPLKSKFFQGVTASKERWTVWENFFTRVLHEDALLSEPKRTPYWGTYVYQKVDWSYVEMAVDIRVGDVLRVRTPTSQGSVTVTKYVIHYNGPAGGNLLLAVAEPLARFNVPDTDILFAAPRLPSCESRCASRKVIPNQVTLDRILAVVTRGAKIPRGLQIKRMTALEGRFTRQARQYVVYVDFGTDSDTNLTGYWRTIVLDTDLSIIGVVGENDYAHIEPRSVGDINGDGLDEVWVDLYGYEGRHAGAIYWRGGSGNDAFRVITNAYNGA